MATEARAALVASFDKRWEARRASKATPNSATWRIIKLLKIDDDDEPTVLKRLHAIIVKVWNGGEMPQEWNDATIKGLYKKGDQSNCNNFRGISLLSHVGKVFAKTITNRLSTFIEANDISRRSSAGSDLADPRYACSSWEASEEEKKLEEGKEQEHEKVKRELAAYHMEVAKNEMLQHQAGLSAALQSELWMTEAGKNMKGELDKKYQLVNAMTDRFEHVLSHHRDIMIAPTPPSSSSRQEWADGKAAAREVLMAVKITDFVVGSIDNPEQWERQEPHPLPSATPYAPLTTDSDGGEAGDSGSCDSPSGGLDDEDCAADCEEEEGNHDGCSNATGSTGETCEDGPPTLAYSDTQPHNGDDEGEKKDEDDGHYGDTPGGTGDMPGGAPPPLVDWSDDECPGGMRTRAKVAGDDSAYDPKSVKGPGYSSASESPRGGDADDGEEDLDGSMSMCPTSQGPEDQECLTTVTLDGSSSRLAGAAATAAAASAYAMMTCSVFSASTPMEPTAAARCRPAMQLVEASSQGIGDMKARLEKLDSMLGLIFPSGCNWGGPMTATAGSSSKCDFPSTHTKSKIRRITRMADALILSAILNGALFSFRPSELASAAFFAASGVWVAFG
eukprot:g7112.t1